ncbi:MAG TPA: DUF1573 domain-containing protein [Sedimentisphaerales bacterium]|nr:DUF1573 domain-containing protein [Sedimentisphaerales bacterium]
MRIGAFLVFAMVVCTSVLGAKSSEDSAGVNYGRKEKNVCGQYCLVSILQYLGRNIHYGELLPVAPAERGTNLAQLKTFAEAYGVKTLGARVTTDMVFAMRRPAILHINGNHFIALLPNKDDPNFTVIDPPQTFAITNAKDLTTKWKWKGNCLLIDEQEMVLPDPDAKPGVPKIFIDDLLFDAGVIFDDTTVISATFKITNKGLGDLVITEVKTDCSCTAAAIENQTIKPGASVPLTIRFDVKGRFGELPARKTLVKTNDPSAPETILTIRAERRREFTVNPASPFMGVLPMGTEKVLLIRITPGAEDKQLSIHEAAASSEFLEVSQIDNDFGSGNPREYLVRVRLLDTTPAGSVNEVVRIPCIGASRKTLEIPIRAEVRGPIQTSLSQVQFGLIRADEKNRTRKIHLRSDKAFELANVTADQPWLEAACEKVNDSQHFLVVTIVPGVAPKGRLEGLVTVDTTMKEMSTVRIPVFAFRL